MAWHDPQIKPLKENSLQVESHGDGLQKWSGGWSLTVLPLEMELPALDESIGLTAGWAGL